MCVQHIHSETDHESAEGIAVIASPEVAAKIRAAFVKAFATVDPEDRTLRQNAACVRFDHYGAPRPFVPEKYPVYFFDKLAEAGGSVNPPLGSNDEGFDALFIDAALYSAYASQGPESMYEAIWRDVVKNNVAVGLMYAAMLVFDSRRFCNGEYVAELLLPVEDHRGFVERPYIKHDRSQSMGFVDITKGFYQPGTFFLPDATDIAMMGMNVFYDDYQCNSYGYSGAFVEGQLRRFRPARMNKVGHFESHKEALSEFAKASIRVIEVGTEN